MLAVLPLLESVSQNLARTIVGDLVAGNCVPPFNLGDVCGDGQVGTAARQGSQKLLKQAELICSICLRILRCSFRSVGLLCEAE